jgi:hypothetical protein
MIWVMFGINLRSGQQFLQRRWSLTYMKDGMKFKSPDENQSFESGEKINTNVV